MSRCVLFQRLKKEIGAVLVSFLRYVPESSDTKGISPSKRPSRMKSTMRMAIFMRQRIAKRHRLLVSGSQESCHSRICLAVASCSCVVTLSPSNLSVRCSSLTMFSTVIISASRSKGRKRSCGGLAMGTITPLMTRPKPSSAKPSSLSSHDCTLSTGPYSASSKRSKPFFFPSAPPSASSAVVIVWLWGKLGVFRSGSGCPGSELAEDAVGMSERR